VNEAKFLFGDDVNNYLDELKKDILFVRDATKPQVPPSPEPTRIELMAAMYRISINFSRIGEPLFAKYMRFTQPMPLITRIDSRPMRSKPHNGACPLRTESGQIAGVFGMSA
jgi:hypothetical protein